MLTTEATDGFGFGGSPSSNTTTSETNMMMENNSDMENYSYIVKCTQNSSGLNELTPEQRAKLADFVRQGGCSQSDAKFVEDIISIIINSENTEEAETYVKAQIALETLTDPKKIKLEPKNGKLNNRDDQEYTHFGTNGIYNVYQLTGGSRVFESTYPLKINSDGNLVHDTSNQDTGEYYYIKPAGETFWYNYWLKDPSNLSEELEKTAKLAGIALAKAIGKYVLPVEDIKIIITGTDFEGEQVSRYKAAGFLLLTIVPGSKALKIVGNAADALTVVVKLGSNNLVVDTVKTGLKIVTDNNIVKFLSNTGDEVARIVDGIMTFKYTGFGGNIVTNPNKTTTLLGRYADNTGNGTKAVLDSKLFKFGENKGGFNLLDESTWSNLNQNQRDLLNHNWLEQAFQRGDDIRLVSDQTNKFSNGILTQYGKELNWIETFINTYNYSYNSTTKTFIKN
ncbi:hypothetical protein JCM19538_2635 [Jejuia pallidilutea]|uniref:Uncharacterized protein n=2 Tax=Jejuia pallidilutea TaxID=504487 RepID=A0A098LPE4_9FLAO|nr:hypothetical protein JCM19538_2635 [Jejuia pallidilutea]